MVTNKLFSQLKDVIITAELGDKVTITVDPSWLAPKARIYAREIPWKTHSDEVYLNDYEELAEENKWKFINTDSLTYECLLTRYMDMRVSNFLF